MCESLDRGWGAWALVHLSEEVEAILTLCLFEYGYFCSHMNDARYYPLPHRHRWSLLQQIIGRREIEGF